jgi:glycosyltransferase 2 family protein
MAWSRPCSRRVQSFCSIPAVALAFLADPIPPCNPTLVEPRDAYALYATTQIMKYIPSNVINFVGRHVALRRRGVSHLALVSTLFGEAAILVCGACLTVLAFKADVLFAVYGRYVRLEQAPIIGALALAFCLCASLTWLHVPGLRRRISIRVHRRLLSRLMLALTAAAVFFASTTLLIAETCRVLLDDPAGVSTSAVAATLAGAWVVGFIISGASAGIGVREAVVILMLSPAVGAANAAVVATIHRIVTAGGDALLARSGGLVRRYRGAWVPVNPRTPLRSLVALRPAGVP